MPTQDVFVETPVDPTKDVIDPETGEVTTVEEPAPEPPSASGKTYMTEALVIIGNAVSLDTHVAWWRSEMGNRLAAGLSEEQALALAEAYDDKYVALGGPAP